MDTPKMITINAATKSNNGVWLLVDDQTNTRHLSKCWELENMVGHTIFAQVGSKRQDDGGVTLFLNKWQYPEGNQSMPEGQGLAAQPAGQGPTGPAPAPMAPPLPPPEGPAPGTPGYGPVRSPPPIQTAVQHPQALIPTNPYPNPPAPQQVDRDASIVAQTLCKTVSFSSIDQAWIAYCELYERYSRWRDNPAGFDPQAEANEQAQNQGQMPDQDIPF